MGELRVGLVDYTGRNAGSIVDAPLYWPKHYAAALLAYTKNTRLQMTPDGFQDWLDKPYAELMQELNYMVNTIPSSWEFVDLTFSIENVTRACAQQITRTRTASYAMQSQRVTDVSEMGFRVPPNAKNKLALSGFANDIMEEYQGHIEAGEEPEDARSILPMNIQCNLLAKYNLRAWIDVVLARQSLRAQDEYREVAELMKQAVRDVYPWIDKFLTPKHANAIKIIEDIAVTLPTEQKRALAKAADLIRKG
jgi:flavin-dependent thymidylate synthase